jgi:hypothetical protein
MRNIQFLMTSGPTAVAVVQLENGGGGQWVKPGILRVLKFKTDDLPAVFTERRLKVSDKRGIENKKFSELAWCCVDLRNQGPRSHHYKSLLECIEIARDEFEAGSVDLELKGSFYELNDLQVYLLKRRMADTPAPATSTRVRL